MAEYAEYQGRVIQTEHVYPPIPERHSDWSAIFKGEYDGAPDSHSLIGRGPTEQAAIADLIEQDEEASLRVIDKDAHG